VENKSLETRIHLNRFKPRSFQLPLFDAFENKKFKKLVAIWPRRSGKDVCAFNLVVREALRRVGVYYYIFPSYSQARKVIWDSLTNDGQRFLDYIPPALVEKTNSQEMKITLTNGSLIQLIGSDNIDSIVGSNPRGCIFSEYALQDPRAYQFIRPILAANDGWALFVSTPRGKNHFWELYQIACESPGWYCSKLTLDDTQHVPLNEIEKERADGLMSEDLIQQEYYCFPAGVPILTPNGIKPIEDIDLDDMVIAHSGRSRRVLDTMSRDYEGHMVEISSYGSFEPLICTPNHPVQVYDQTTQTYSWKAAENVVSEDLLVFPKRNVLLGNFISHDMCMLMAWYICDGSSFKNGVQFTVNKKKASRIKDLLNNISLPFNEMEVGKCVNIMVGNVSLVDFMKTTCGSFCYNKKIPLDMLGEHAKDFFYELMKGDGCLSTTEKTKRYSFSTTSKHLAYQIQFLANSINDGLAAGITMRPEGVAVFPGGRKYDTRESYSVQITFHTLRSKNSFLRRAKNCIAAKIRNIKMVPFSGKVYNFSVQYDESYIAAGRSVHNCSFTMGVEGAYYARYVDKMRVNNQIGNVPWELGFKVHTAWDIGVRDATAIIFFQVVGQTIRIIDCYQKSKEGLEHYVNIIKSKPYVYGKHIAPHDIAVREFGSGITRLEKARNLGIDFTVSNNVSIVDGIESVRSALSKIWIDTEKCKDLLKAIENYRQEYDAKKRIYKSHPLHDWSSHYCFVASTLLLTRNGMRPIMDIDDGDEVLTLHGWRKCTKSTLTKKNVDLVEVVFSDNTKVKCTPDHLFLTEKGWKSAESLGKDIKIQSSLMNLHNTLMESCIGYGRMKGILLAAENLYIEQYGKMLLEKYLTIATYITKTLMPLVINYSTSNASISMSISVFLDQILRDLVSVLEIRQLSGIDLPQEDYGIRDMLKDQKVGQNGKESQENVFCAKKSLTALLDQMVIHKNSAIPIARQLTIAEVNYLDDKEDVWDISVPGIQHFSLENGAIVHNSDAMRYLCVSLPKTRDGLTPEDLDKRYYEALYGDQGSLPSIFRDDHRHY
jgi:hypothetical protein